MSRSAFDAARPDFQVDLAAPVWSGDLVLSEERLKNAPLAAVPHPTLGGMLVAQQHGIIYHVRSGAAHDPVVWQDLRPLISNLPEWGFGSAFADERGLLGLALHPQFAKEGSPFEGVYFAAYTTGTTTEGVDNEYIVARLSVLDEGDAVGRERRLLSVEQAEPNHNGGSMVFGPPHEDIASGIGYLYVGVGDGGGAGDQHGSLIDPQDESSFLGNAQDLTVPLGKILRLDVNRDEAQGYWRAAPGNFNRDELYARGLRNVWGMSFDARGRLFAADVGQNKFEEVNIIVNGGNYGWRAVEGGTADDFTSENVFNRAVLEKIGGMDNVERPILHFNREDKFPSAVIGGYVYRGRNIPALRGKYVFADYHGDIFYAVEDGEKEGSWTMETLIAPKSGRRVHAIGETAEGELWFMLALDPPQSRFEVRELATAGLSMGDIEALHAAVADASAAAVSATRKPFPRQSQMFSTVTTRDGFSDTGRTRRDAWIGSRDISAAKAFTALAFSSDANAFTTRTIGSLSQTGPWSKDPSPLWGIGDSNPRQGIIQFPGGVPLYRGGRLVGGLGVSGDAPVIDEEVAVKAATALDLMAPDEIRAQPFDIRRVGLTVLYEIGDGIDTKRDVPLVVCATPDHMLVIAEKETLTPICEHTHGALLPVQQRLRGVVCPTCDD